MKKVVFAFLTILVGIIGYYSTVVALFCVSKGSYNPIEACLWSYLGVLLPTILLEKAKCLFLNDGKNKIYVVDIVGVLISISAIVILNCLQSDDISFADWIINFFMFQFSWVIASFMQIVLLVSKAKNKRH